MTRRGFLLSFFGRRQVETASTAFGKRTRIALQIASGALTGAWILLASLTAWLLPLTALGSAGAGWLLSRVTSKLGANSYVALFSLPVCVVCWFWVAVPADPDFGHLFHTVAVLQVAVVVLFFAVSRYVTLRRV